MKKLHPTKGIGAFAVEIHLKRYEPTIFTENYRRGLSVFSFVKRVLFSLTYLSVTVGASLGRPARTRLCVSNCA